MISRIALFAVILLGYAQAGMDMYGAGGHESYDPMMMGNSGGAPPDMGGAQAMGGGMQDGIMHGDDHQMEMMPDMGGAQAYGMGQQPMADYGGAQAHPYEHEHEHEFAY